MKPKDYIEKAKRTEVKYNRVKVSTKNLRMEHAIDGLVTEAGELMEDYKAFKFYGSKLSKKHLIENAGDLFWYLAILCDELGVTFEEVWEKNIKKLVRRYNKKSK